MQRTKFNESLKSLSKIISSNFLISEFELKGKTFKWILLYNINQIECISLNLM